MNQQHIITFEYPPLVGGVGDYSYKIASELAKKQVDIHVWCPKQQCPLKPAKGVTVHDSFDDYSPKGLRELDVSLNCLPQPRNIIVQWVPHGYGLQAMNIFFCLWLWKRGRINGDRINMVVHEPYLDFSLRSWKRIIAAFVQRLMTVIYIQGCHDLWLATPSWIPKIKRYSLGRTLSYEWLPIPSNISVEEASVRSATIRDRFLRGPGKLIGHFGSFNKLMRHELNSIVPQLVSRDPRTVFLLIGKESDKFLQELVIKYPELDDLVFATGCLPSNEISWCLNACDVMVQPYRDKGLNARNSSALALLAHGLPMVAYSGSTTEAFWFDSEAAILIPDFSRNAMIEATHLLLQDPARQRTVSEKARSLYSKYFEMEHAIRLLCAKWQQA